MSTPLRALLVVADAAVRFSLVEHLMKERFVCDGIGDAATAEALLSIRPYDAVFAEANPDDPDGPRVLASLACRPDRPRLFVYAPLPDPRLVAGLAMLRADELIVPPVDARAVAAKMSRLLRGSPDPPAPPPPIGPATARAVVLIRLSDPDRARALTAQLRAEQFAAEAIDTADELHSRLHGGPADLLVIENRLPGFLSGLDVLEAFREELSRPEAVLLAGPEDQPHRVRALQPARVLPPNCGVREIVDAVRGAASQRHSGGIPLPQAARRAVAQHPGVRPMPQLVVKPTGRLAADGGAISAAELAREIAVDPKATTELLRHTNGAATGLRRRVTNVADAVALLGARQSISLLVSSAAVASARDLLRHWPGSLETWYRRRSVLTASAAYAFARLENVSPDTAFLLGLFQDLGILVQAGASGGRYEQVVERVRTVAPLRLETVERAEYGFTHAEVSAALLQLWQLPPSLVRPVLAHHGDDSRLSATERGYVRVMRIGEAVADLLDRVSPQRRQALNRLLAGYGAANETGCRAALADAVAKAAEASEIFAVPAPGPDTLCQLEAGLLAAQAEAEPAPL